MKTKLCNYIKAAYPGIFIVSFEETRVESVIAEVRVALDDLLPKAERQRFEIHAWSCTEGAVNVSTGKKTDNSEDPLGALEAFIKAPARTIYLLRDFHLFVEDKNPLVWRRLKDALNVAKNNFKTLIILGCRLTLPVELEKELSVIEFSLPDKEQLRRVVNGVIDGNGLPAIGEELMAGVLNAGSGLTTIEFENAISLSIAEIKAIDKHVIYREKCQIVKKNGLLEVVESKLTLDNIGGLGALKKWLLERRDAFGAEAKTYGLPAPKGFMAVGQPGTGKSLVAKATRSVFDLPLLRLDASRLFGSLVGESERNWRTVHATLKAMSPCIAWVDEVDGMFSGGASSGQTDGGTTARVIKSILQDMQENSDGIFYVFTANDVDNLPSPVLRRLDEVWNVELPTAIEREQILAIQLKKYGLVVDSFDVTSIAASTEGYSGAEIEKIVVQSMYRAFADGRRTTTTEDVTTIIAEFMPVSKTMAEDIERRRKRLQGVARLASGTETTAPVAKGSRKLTSFRATPKP